MIIRLFLIIPLCLFYRSACGQAEMPTVTQILESFQKEDAFSGVVLLADRGKIIEHRAVGPADRSAQLPVDLDTKFRIASITKSFTALLIMQLYEAGKLRLDQSVAELLPELAGRDCRQITVHHLLNHTSGLPNEPDAFYQQKMSPKEIVERLIREKKSTKVGKAFNYNNVDYLLLGLIIEKLSDKPWEVVVREQILEPLEMQHTGFLAAGSLPVGLAKGYLCKSGACDEEPAYYIENFYAAGNMYSTAEDLLKWDQGLYGAQLLTEATKTLMYTSDPKLGYVAYGSWTFDHPFVAGHPFTVERRGGILGFNSVIMRFPKAERTLIILSNTDQFNPDTFGNSENLKEQLVQQLFALE